MVLRKKSKNRESLGDWTPEGKKKEKEKSCRFKKSWKNLFSFSFTFLVLSFHLFVLHFSFPAALPPATPQMQKKEARQANVSPYDEGSCETWGWWRAMGERRLQLHSCSAEKDTKTLPAGRIPMCCWPSNTKLPIGWPSGLYAAPWLTEGSRRKPDCSQSWTQRRKKRRHTKQSAIVPASALKRYIQYLGCHFKLRLCFLWADYVTRTIE